MQPIVLFYHDENFGQTQDAYPFKGNNGLCRWPKNAGAGLGRCGMLNFLWRLGFHPKELHFDQLTTPKPGEVLFVDKISAMHHAMQSALQQWMQQGGKIIATGELNAWRSFLTKEEWHTASFENPYAATAYIFGDDVPQLITPPRWSFIQYDGSAKTKAHYLGNLAAVQGERQTPARAQLECYPNAPAIIHHHLFYYLNAQPFAAFQAWLQGQENLSPWLLWRHRLFWLDEWVSFCFEMLANYQIISKEISRPGIKELNHTTVVLRHDLDYSRDTLFLSTENQRKISATYAVLKDRNTRFWLKQLSESNNHEIAFHYNTGKRTLKSIYQRVVNKKNQAAFAPAMQQIARKGLLKQLQWAKKQGIPVQTIHRHISYLIYPEWIDAMDTVFESNLNVLGSSSLFRGQVLKWGMDHVDGNHGYLTDWPDAQFPFWYPFKLAHVGKQGKILQGWEMTALMEVEPHLLTQLLDYKIKHISQTMFNLIFHPAHASQSTFYQKGSFSHFLAVLDILKERNIEILPLSHVFQKANMAWQR